jgi:glycosyltransferase involved in cell wall biosynthesis
MSGPLVSFVVPAYNEAALIGACLAAIRDEIDRAGCDAEIIVVNNGSTDATRQIASSTPGVIVVDEPERGLVPARRAGCLAARGTLIANIDADTILPEGWLATALREFEKCPNLAALSGPFIHYDLSRSAQTVAKAFYCIAFLVYMLMRFIFRAGSMIQGGNFIVSKGALDAAGGFNPDFRFYGEDTEIARRLSKVGPVKFSFALPAYSSGRRFAAEGLFRVGARYATNYVWTVLFKQPFSPTWLDFRHAEGGGATPTTATPVRAEPPAA